MSSTSKETMSVSTADSTTSQRAPEVYDETTQINTPELYTQDDAKSEKTGEFRSEVVSHNGLAPHRLTLEEESEVVFPPLKDPPNGGFKAWMQVLAGFFALFNSWGVVNTFGAYEAYYQSELLKGESPSTIAWIGSIQGCFVIGGAIISGRLVDGGYSTYLLYIGSFLVVFGMMMASISSEFYQLFLSQGVCVGLGCSMLFLTSVAIVAQYFTTKRAAAMGIVACGSSVGGVIYPIMIHKLIEEVGFGWATRILAFMILALMSIPCLVLRHRLPPRKSGPLIDPASLRDLPFLLYTAGAFFGFMGVYIPIFFIQSYALHEKIDPQIAFYTTSMLNAGSVLGRLIPNYLADKLGPLNVLTPTTICSCILTFCWIAISDQGGIIGFAVLFGFFSGTFVSLPPACIASMTKDMSVLGTRLGMSFFVCAFGVLAGTPVAGAIIEREGGQFLYAKVFGGIAIFISVACLAGARMLITGPHLLSKA